MHFPKLIIVMLLFIAVNGARCYASSGFNPNTPDYISVTSGQWKVAFVGRRLCRGDCKSTWELVFQVTNLIARTNHQLVLSTGMAQVDRAYIISGNRALLLGKANGDVDQAAIVNLQSHSVSRAFLCYSPEISPSLRYLAFVYFFPPHGTPDNLTSNVYGLLDMESATTNNTGPEAFIYSNPAIGAIPMYPAQNYANHTAVSLVPSGSSLVHRKVSLFTWVNDSVQFTDEVGTVRMLVIVNFGSGMNNLRVRTKVVHQG